MSSQSPRLTVDIIINISTRIVLIKRKNPPYGWALPGGVVNYGETVEAAAIREAKEETGLDLSELKQFYVYSDPNRDPRGHNVSVVFTAVGIGKPKASDDAKEIGLFSPDDLPKEIAFDHRKILSDYFKSRSDRFVQSALDGDEVIGTREK
uniref:NUDIX hydrolase n=1 Tax=candidate division WOR-3 bacterium TaxID=2052148 RepID=A0A7C6EBB7_UNCW3